MSMQMFFYEGRYMSPEDILAVKNSDKKVIETPSDAPKVEIKKEVIDSPKVEKEVELDELENARAEYEKIFNRKANPNTKLETLLNKVAEANA